MSTRTRKRAARSGSDGHEKRTRQVQISPPQESVVVDAPGEAEDVTVQPIVDDAPAGTHTLEGLAAEVSNLKTTLVELLTKNGQGTTPQDNPGFHSILPDASASAMPDTQDFNEFLPSQAVNLHTVPLGAAVPLHVRQKIWSNEFVDLGSLILKFDPQPSRLVIDPANFTAPIQAHPMPPRKLKSIEEWTDVFLTYTSLYCSAHPNQAPALMKYMSNVRDIASRGGDWMEFDTKFRQLRANPSTFIPWDSFHPELWVKSSIRSTNFVAKPSNPNGTQAKKVQNPANVPKGYCFRYHSGGACNKNCRLRHECPTCGTTHAAGNCTRHKQQNEKGSHFHGAKPKHVTS